MGLLDFVKSAGKALGIGSADAAEAPAPEALKKEIESHGLDASGLTVENKGDTVVLKGKAKSQEEKEKAIISVGNIAGVAKVEEEVEVPPPGAGLGAGGRGRRLVEDRGEVPGQRGAGRRSSRRTARCSPTPTRSYPGQVLRIPAKWEPAGASTMVVVEGGPGRAAWRRLEAAVSASDRPAPAASSRSRSQRACAAKSSAAWRSTQSRRCPSAIIFAAALRQGPVHPLGGWKLGGEGVEVAAQSRAMASISSRKAVTAGVGEVVGGGVNAAGGGGWYRSSDVGHGEGVADGDQVALVGDGRGPWPWRGQRCGRRSRRRSALVGEVAVEAAERGAVGGGVSDEALADHGAEGVVGEDAVGEGHGVAPPGPGGRLP